LIRSDKYDILIIMWVIETFINVLVVMLSFIVFNVHVQVAESWVNIYSKISLIIYIAITNTGI